MGILPSPIALESRKAGLRMEWATDGLTTDYADVTDGMRSAKSRGDDRK